MIIIGKKQDEEEEDTLKHDTQHKQTHTQT